MRPGGDTPDRPLVPPGNGRRIAAVGQRASRLERRFVGSPSFPSVDFSGDVSLTLEGAVNQPTFIVPYATYVVVGDLVVIKLFLQIDTDPGSAGGGSPGFYMIQLGSAFGGIFGPSSSLALNNRLVVGYGEMMDNNALVPYMVDVTHLNSDAIVLARDGLADPVNATNVWAVAAGDTIFNGTLIFFNA